MLPLDIACDVYTAELLRPEKILASERGVAIPSVLGTIGTATSARSGCIGDGHGHGENPDELHPKNTRPIGRKFLEGGHW